MIRTWTSAALHAVLTTATTITQLAIGVLYAIAYAVIGYGIGTAIEGTGLGGPALYAWLMIWVGAGTVALTVWTIRMADIDVRRRPAAMTAATTAEDPEPTRLITFRDAGDDDYTQFLALHRPAHPGDSEGRDAHHPADTAPLSQPISD